MLEYIKILKRLSQRVYILSKSIAGIAVGSKARNTEEGNKLSLVIFTGLLGDAVFAIEPIKRLRSYYKGKGEDIVIATRKMPAEFLMLIDDLSDVRFAEVDFKRYCEEISA